MEVNQIELGLAMSNNNSNSTNISSKPTIPAEIPPISELTKPYLLPKESPFHVPPHVVMARLDDEVKELQAHVRELQMRNYIKDTGKKFEGSWARVGVIMVLTYITLCTYMYLINVPSPFLNAIVPTVGFNLSTWSLPQVKKFWISVYDWNYGKGRSELRAINEKMPVSAVHLSPNTPLPVKPPLPQQPDTPTHAHAHGSVFADM